MKQPLLQIQQIHCHCCHRCHHFKREREPNCQPRLFLWLAASLFNQEGVLHPAHAFYLSIRVTYIQRRPHPLGQAAPMQLAVRILTTVKTQSTMAGKSWQWTLGPAGCFMGATGACRLNSHFPLIQSRISVRKCYHPQWVSHPTSVSAVMTVPSRHPDFVKFTALNTTFANYCLVMSLNCTLLPLMSSLYFTVLKTLRNPTPPKILCWALPV